MSQNKTKLKGIDKFTKFKISQKKDLIFSLDSNYNCKNDFLLEFDFYLSNSSKLYITNAKTENLDLSKLNSIGLYFGSFHDSGRFRLSIEGSKFIKPKKNFIVLNEKSFQSYITAENLFTNEVEEINTDKTCPFLIVIYENENLGSVSIRKEEILTYVPKSRKLDYNKVY